MSSRFPVAVAVLAMLACASAACSGGGKGSSSDGQPDYADQVVALFSNCRADGTPTVESRDTRVQRALMERIAAWMRLTPPAELAALHKSYGDALARFEQATLNRTSESSASQQEVADSYAAWERVGYDFEEAFEAHYGPKLFKVEGASMEPTLSNGDVVSVHEFDGVPKRWDILVFTFPLDQTREFIKRVVGLPGEIVEVRDGAVLINGATVDGDTNILATANYTYGPKTVPPDSYFVLGDNRRNSFDSHAWGIQCGAQARCDFVPTADILGVVADVAKGCKTRASS